MARNYRNYRNSMLEGGEGYNPHRAEAPYEPTERDLLVDRRDKVTRLIGSCGDPDRRAELYAELDKLKAELDA